MAGAWYWAGGLSDDGFGNGPTGTGYQPHNFAYGAAVANVPVGRATKLAVRTISASGQPTLKLSLHNSAGSLLADGSVANDTSIAWRECAIDVLIAAGTYEVMVSSSDTNSQYFHASGNGIGESVAHAAFPPATISTTEDEVGTRFAVKIWVEDPEVTLSGTATAAITEADVVAGAKTAVLTVANDTVVPASQIGDISFIANALGGTTTTTSFSITLPATQAGDLIILEFAHRGTGDGTIGGTYTGPAFTLKHSQLFATSAFSGKTYCSIASGDHNGETVTGASLTNACAAIVTIYRGADPTTPLGDATIVGEQNASGDETQAEITTATNKAWVVLVVVNSPDLAVSTQACTSPTLTERAEVLSTGGTDASIAHASGLKATAGATGAFTWAQTNGASGSWAYAIKPATLTPFANARAAIRDGFVSAQAEAAGFNARRATIIPLGNIVRTGDNVITVTFAADAGFDITAQEVVTDTLPASALVGNVARVASPTFTIDTGGAGTQFQQSVSGTLTTAGALAKETRKGPSGTVTSSGALLKSTSRALLGTLTTAGALAAAKTALRSVEGTLTTAGALAAVKTALVSVAGTLTSAGALATQAQKAVVGTLTPAGALTRQAAHLVAGTLASSGALAKHTARALTGTLTSTAAATAIKTALKAVDGTLTSAGSLTSITQRVVSLSATLTSAGALARVVSKGLSGTLTSVGALAKRLAQSLAGLLTPSGSLTAAIPSRLGAVHTATAESLVPSYTATSQVASYTVASLVPSYTVERI